MNIREQVEETIENLEKENDNLKENNVDMRKTLAGLRGSIKAYERRDLEKNRELNMMGKKMGNLKTADMLEQSLINKEHKIKELEDLNLENEKLLQTFEEELEKKTKTIEDLEYKNGSKTEEIHELKFKLNEYRKKFEKYTSIEQKINILMMENKALKEELANNKGKVMVSNIDDRDDYEDRIAELEIQIEKLKELIKKLNLELDDWRKKYNDLKKRIKYWEDQRDEMVEKLNRLEFRYDDKVKECDEKTMLNSKLVVKLFSYTWLIRSKYPDH